MLQPPRKNFGYIPSTGLLAHIAVFLLGCIVPLSFTLYSALTGKDIASMEALLTGIRLVITVLYVSLLFLLGPRNLWETSKRQRYVTKHLMPFLHRKYGIRKDSLRGKSSELLSGQPVFFPARKDSPVELMLVGWESIATAAEDGTPIKNLGDKVHVLQSAGPGIMREIPVIGGDEKDRVVLQSETVPSLDDTETGIRTMIAKAIQEIPHGHSRLQCLAPANGAISGVEYVFEIVHNDEELRYSPKSFEALVEAILFNVRMAGSALVVSLVNAESGVDYICGQIVQNAGYSDISVETLKEISSESDTDGLVFVKNIKEMH